MKTELIATPDLPTGIDPTTRMQLRWDPLDYLDAGHATSLAQAAALAKSDRQVWVSKQRKLFPLAQIRPWTLEGQLRPYASFGVPDGRYRNVYYVNITGA